MEFKKVPYSSWVNVEKNISYLFYKTKDDSISVSLTAQNYSTELMHSVDGALTETIYLYESVVKHACKQNLPLNFLSIGLGLGYIEILVCAYLLKYSPQSNFKIFSFEKESELTFFFKEYILERAIPPDFEQTYNSIVESFCQQYALTFVELKRALKNAIENKQIILYGEYALGVELDCPVSGVFFDAFSAGTAPELWTNELLSQIMQSCGPEASFATYASRTALKKQLLAHGFCLEKKPGYGGKKESTFAFKKSFGVE